MHFENYHIDETVNLLKGPTKEQIIVYNQWAATALDNYHQNSAVDLEINIDKLARTIRLSWSSNFSKEAMKEKERWLKKVACQ